jgi:hypothetical protein
VLLLQAAPNTHHSSDPLRGQSPLPGDLDDMDLELGPIVLRNEPSFAALADFTADEETTFHSFAGSLSAQLGSPSSPTAGNSPLTTGNTHLTAGDMHLTAGNSHLTAGDMHLTAGDSHLTAGNSHLTAGNSHLTAGGAHLTAGGEQSRGWGREGTFQYASPPSPDMSTLLAELLSSEENPFSTTRQQASDELVGLDVLILQSDYDANWQIRTADVLCQVR